MRLYFLLTAGIAILIAVGLLNILAFQYYWYWLIWWFDLLMHTLGGLGLGLVLLGLGELNLKLLDKNGFWRLALSVMVIVMLISVAWEFFEFTTDHAHHNYLIVKTPLLLQQGARDTASDLLSDLFGVLLAIEIVNLTLWPKQA